MAWEKTALDLADRCGIRVPACQLLDVAGRHVLLLERFDRTEGQRVGYISAMTLLGLHDGDRADYLEIAEALTAHGCHVTDDLEQLWRRIAFSLVINNTDDHLRNHGFLHADGGWRLSPAFDLNPDPDPAAGRVTTIGFAADAHEGLQALLASARDFGLADAQAQSVLEEVLAGTSTWRATAAANGVTELQSDRFAPSLDRFHARQR